MQQELLFVFIVVFFIDSVAPGPAVAMVMSRGASVGLTRTLPFIAGLVIGDVLLFLAALLGLAAIAVALGPLFLVVKWVGIAYLLYLAYTAWHSSLIQVHDAPAQSQGWRSFGLALILPLGNPKAVGFYVALLPTVMDVKTLSYLTALQFTLVIIIIWGLVLIAYTALADKGRSIMRQPSWQKWLNRGAAGAMVGAAGTIAFRD